MIIIFALVFILVLVSVWCVLLRKTFKTHLKHAGLSCPSLLAGWLACWPAGWLAGWLEGCLVGWFLVGRKMEPNNLRRFMTTVVWGEESKTISSDDTANRVKHIKRRIKLQRKLSEQFGQDFVNLSEAHSCIERQDPDRVLAVERIADQRNAAKHSNFLNRPFVIGGHVWCYHAGEWVCLTYRSSRMQVFMILLARVCRKMVHASS